MRLAGKRVPWLGVIAAGAIAALIVCAVILVWGAVKSSGMSPQDMRGGWLREEALLRILYVAPIWMVVAGVGL